MQFFIRFYKADFLFFRHKIKYLNIFFIVCLGITHLFTHMFFFCVAVPKNSPSSLQYAQHFLVYIMKDYIHLMFFLMIEGEDSCHLKLSCCRLYRNDRGSIDLQLYSVQVEASFHLFCTRSYVMCQNQQIHYYKVILTTFSDIGH